MPVAALKNVPSTPDQLGYFAFVHMDHHLRMNDKARSAFGVALPSFDLSTLDTDRMEGWIDEHQQMHQNLDQLLGLEGYNLLDVDWKDPNQLAGWVYLNFQSHFNEATVLNVW